MRIFIAATSLRLSYGGPAYSVTRLAAQLARSGHAVCLWSADGSAPDSILLSGVSGLVWSVGQVRGQIAGFAPDVIHDNGIWLAHNHAIAQAARRTGVPRIVSARGMLEPWAMQHKKWKKLLAWSMYQRSDLKSATTIHATSSAEAGNMERLGLGAPVVVIPNGVDLPPPEVSANRKAARATRQFRTALFLGRLYPVKGLPMLIESWSRVRPEGWILKIAGPDEAGHQRELEAAVRQSGLEKTISFIGPVSGEAKQRLFEGADLFVLPTLSESFGMSIAEALAHELPVLTTTSAPWPTLEERACGWLADPTTEGIEVALGEATSLPTSQLDAMGARGREMVSAEFGWERIASESTACYKSLSSGPKKGR